ncbi:hypothetical protein ACA910_011085 [Epithemia clementina (nom. ined.)]
MIAATSRLLMALLVVVAVTGIDRPGAMNQGVANFLQEKFPELRGKIEGANYPAPPIVEFLSHVVSIAQLIGLAWMLLGSSTFFRMVGLQRPPAWAATVQQNAIQIGIFLFLLLPQFLAKWTATGAFEVYLDGETVFSKLSEGRFPKPEELIKAIASAGLEVQ